MEKIIHTPADIYTTNYYYVQVFTADEKNWVVYIVCFAENKHTAIVAIHNWLNSLKLTGERRDIHLYQKNYKIQSKKMVAEGNYISDNDYKND